MYISILLSKFNKFYQTYKSEPIFRHFVKDIADKTKIPKRMGTHPYLRKTTSGAAKAVSPMLFLSDIKLCLLLCL